MPFRTVNDTIHETHRPALFKYRALLIPRNGNVCGLHSRTRWMRWRLKTYCRLQILDLMFWYRRLCCRRSFLCICMRGFYRVELVIHVTAREVPASISVLLSSTTIIAITFLLPSLICLSHVALLKLIGSSVRYLHSHGTDASVDFASAVAWKIRWPLMLPVRRLACVRNTHHLYLQSTSMKYPLNCCE